MVRTTQTFRKSDPVAKRVTRRFSCTMGKSSKFWQISIFGAATTVSFGKIGSAGSSAAPKQHASEAAAQAEVDKLVREKLKGGYREEVADTNDDGDDNDDDDDDDDDDDVVAPKASASAKRSRLNLKGKASTTAPTAAKYISFGHDEFDVTNPFDEDEDVGDFQNGQAILPKKAHKLLAIGDIVDFSPDDGDGGSCLFVGPGHVWLSGCHSGNFESLTVPLAISTRFADAIAHYASVTQDRWCCYFLSGNDAWIRKQFEDAGAAADLDAEWTFEVQFDDDLLQSVSVVSRAWAEFSRPREDDDDDSGNVIASVGFQDRDDDAGTDPILSASTWVPLLITKIKAKK